jgi:ATP-dependent helicase IRC3
MEVVMTTVTKPSTLALRPYQEEAIEAINDAADVGITRPLVALPTGTGKTVIFAHLIDQRPGRALVLAHRDELIRQAVDKLLMVNPDFQIGVVKAEENQVAAPVVAGSVQTLARPNRLEQMGWDFSTVIVDEAHHAVADSYQRILGYVGSFDKGGPLAIGFTATPERGDKVGLGRVWERIVFQKSLLEMITAGYLCDLRALRITLKADLDRVHTRHGDFVDSELESALLAANAPAHVVQAYRGHAAGRKALVFTPTVRLAHEMAEAFQNAGIAAEGLDGTTAADVRHDILARLRSGVTMVVCNCAVLTEGFDEPSVDCIIIARPTKSKPLYIQMIGRGTRTYPGKADCLVLDVVGVTKRHSIMTASAVFELDLRSRTVKEAAAWQEQRERILAERATGVLSGELVAQEVDLFKARTLNWIRTGGGAWVLSVGSGFVRLAPSHDDLWDVHYQETGKQPVLLRSALPLGYAQGVGEDFAREQGAGVLLNRDARWRTEPASEKQLHHLRRNGISISPGLTKGQAYDLLSALWGDSAWRRR